MHAICWTYPFQKRCVTSLLLDLLLELQPSWVLMYLKRIVNDQWLLYSLFQENVFEVSRQHLKFQLDFIINFSLTNFSSSTIVDTSWIFSNCFCHLFHFGFLFRDEIFISLNQTSFQWRFHMHWFFVTSITTFISSTL